jgi:hypothetical protein
MKAQSKFAKLAFLVITGSLLPCLSTLATAESDAAQAIRASAANIPTNIPGIHTYAEPPTGFNPLAASEAELATYGFPPRPNKGTNPDDYTMWERAMSAAKIRWHGELKPLLGSGHGMSQAGSSPGPEAAQAQASGPQQISTNNASGVVLTNSQKAWSNTNSFSNVVAEVTVAKAQLPFANTSCTSSNYEEFSYVGIDGFVFDTGNGYGFDPMLQAGVYADVNCPTGASYYAVIGVETDLVAEFRVNPGDVVYEQIIVNGGTSTVSVVLLDITANVYGSYSFSVSGIAGTTADFIVGRPCCLGNVNYPLPNTTEITFNGGMAETGNSTVFYPGSQASSTEILTMTDDLGDQNIEVLSGQGSSGYQGQHSLWFTTTGCAWAKGCTP